MNKAKVVEHIVKWLKDYAQKAGVRGFVIGVSGGIDSALTSTLCAMTGLETWVLEMPIHQGTEQVSRSSKHINWLRSNFEEVFSDEMDLTRSYDDLDTSLSKKFMNDMDSELYFLTLANTRSRLRMLTLYAYATMKSLLVCGTGNKIEDFGVGFYTKYGDGGVDISPIADLTKSEVYELARHLNISKSILEAPPTDGLWDDDRTDEDQIGATYRELEESMKIQEQFGLEPPENAFSSQREKEVWRIYRSRHLANKHKMIPIPVCTIPDEYRNPSA